MIDQRRLVPVNVDAAIAKSLEKLPFDRFTDAQGVASALSHAAFRHGAGCECGGDYGSVESPHRWAGGYDGRLGIALAWSLLPATGVGTVRRAI